MISSEFTEKMENKTIGYVKYISGLVWMALYSTTRALYSNYRQYKLRILY